MSTRRSGAPPATGLLAAVLVAAAALPPLLVGVRLGADDGGAVFAAAWLVGLVPAVGGTVVAWWTAGRADPVGRAEPAGAAAVERALTLVVPVVVVVLVGSPWILAAVGRQARDTGVGALMLLALAAVPYTVVVVASRAAARQGRVAGAVVAPAAALLAGVAIAWLTVPVVGVVGAAAGWLVAWSTAGLVRFRAAGVSPGHRSRWTVVTPPGDPR